MPSLLNSHPLRTSTTPKQPPPQQQPKLSSAHIDLWEHAALLYHHFEWQTAIETFQHLFHTIPTSSSEARTRCLLNAGIIQARLGDYALAAQTLEDAARTDGEFVLTPFLLGIVEWELGNLIKAEACLEISLVALRRYKGEREVGGFPYGVGFMFREEIVRDMLERLRGVDPLNEEAQSTIVGFAVLEAEFIFEAPAREGELEDVSAWRREKEVISTGKTSISRQSEHLSASLKPAVKNPRETFQELKSFLRGHKPIPPPRPSKPGVLTLLDPSRPPQPPTAKAEATYHSTWRRRPPTPYIPRDARGEYHSVGELARFIRRYQNQVEPMSPRDPRGEAESTGELASSHYPSSSSKDDEDRASAETITLLLPKVYEGAPPTTIDKPSNLTRLSLQLLDPSPSHPSAEDDNNPLANFHTAGSETSSLFRQSMLTIERAQVARSEALRRLEGRMRVGVKKNGLLGRGERGRGGKWEQKRKWVGEQGEEGLRNGWFNEGRRGGNGGGVPTITTTAAPSAVVGTVDTVSDLSNRKLNGNGIPSAKTATTVTAATPTTGKANFLLPSQSKPLPPGPPLGKAGRFEVFLADGYQNRGKGDHYGDDGRNGMGEVGRREKENREGGENAVRIPSSKIFEYMSRG
ncbi:hypothetical protein KC343_g6904 [Hortaea werneckii]|nr:hypothetical protein KC343_g6904 [Hortaea werneckii]KAI7653916.1 hypothetical protein KC319_g10392 [Hortaea werneckii]